MCTRGTQRQVGSLSLTNCGDEGNVLPLSRSFKSIKMKGNEKFSSSDTPAVSQHA